MSSYYPTLGVFTLGLCASLPAQSVHVVDATSPDIQAAVNAASPGDTVLIKSGSASALVIDKSLSVLVDDGATATVGRVKIENIDASESVYVRGLNADAGNAVATNDRVFEIYNCAGSVWIEDCSVIGRPFQSTFTHWISSVPEIHEPLWVRFSDQVILIDSSFTGAPFIPSEHYAGHGAVFEASNVSAFGCTFAAGSGGSRGTPGVLIAHSEVYLQDSTCRGGQVANGCAVNGEGVLVLGPTSAFRHLDADLVGGAGQPAVGSCPALPAGPSVVMVAGTEDVLTATPPGLTFEGIRREGETVTFEMTGTPGNGACLCFSIGASSEYLRRRNGPFLLAAPRICIPSPIPPWGTVSLPLVIPELGPFQSVNLYTQIIEVRTGPAMTAGTGHVLTMFDRSF